MKKNMLVAGMVISFVVAIFSLSYAADVIKLKYSNFFPPTYKYSVLVAQFCDEIKKRTNGRVEIVHYPGGTLTSAPKVFNGVTHGISDIGLSTAGYNKGRFPVAEAWDLPLGFSSGWVATQVANDFFRKFKPKEWDNVHVLYLYGTGPNVFKTLNKPVRTLEDMKGLKIRAQGGQADIAKILGTTPVPFEMVDVYEALRRGVVDGALTPAEVLKGWKLGEVLKYATPLKGIQSSIIFYVVMNKEKWSALPNDIKEIFNEVSLEWIEKQARAVNEADAEGIEFLKQNGGQVINISDAEAKRWEQVAAPLVTAYKQRLLSIGYKQAELDAYTAYIKERIAFWIQREKEKGIPTPYR
jgi:TRAP-type C4-dicarboxylate transport system substrate-binding protein